MSTDSGVDKVAQVRGAQPGEPMAEGEDGKTAKVWVAVGVALAVALVVGSILVFDPGLGLNRQPAPVATDTATNGASAPDAQQSPSAVAEPEVVATEPPDAPTEAPVPAEETAAADDAPVETAEPAAPADTAPPSLPLPEFDVVRITPDGNALVAGRSAPGAEVSIMVDGTQTVVGAADTVGKFALVFDLEPSETPRLMTLSTKGSDGAVVESGQNVIIAPTSAPPEPAVEAPEIAAVSDSVEASPTDQAPSVEEETQEVAADEQTEIASADPDLEEQTGRISLEEAVSSVAPIEEAPEAPSAPAVLLADESGVRVLQDNPAAAVPEGVSIDAVTTGADGAMAISGRASGGGFIRLYADNSELATVQVDALGNWRAMMPRDLPPRFMMRVDQLDPDANVIARNEIEVTRETREQLDGLLVEEVRAGDAGSVVVTVQKGFTLWAIAREEYGDGRLYVKVFEANREQIRDPDLIYPGQVFTVPVSEIDPG